MQMRVFILTDFSKFPTKNSSNNNITAPTTTTPAPNHFLHTNSVIDCIDSQYIRQLQKIYNIVGSLNYRSK